MLASWDADQVAQLAPSLHVCAAPDSPKQDCSQAFSIGEVPLTVGKSLTLYMASHGNTTLTVEEFSTEDGITTTAILPVSIGVGESKALELQVSAAALGPQVMKFSLASDDSKKSLYVIELQYVGIPKPVPDIQFCDDANGVSCDSEMTIDFGLVRRSQQASSTFYLKNAGTATLAISAVRTEGMASAENEITIATSTRSGIIEPGVIVPVVVVYEPKDGVDDSVTVVFECNDPDMPQGKVTISGKSNDNAPPSAIAQEQSTGSTSIDMFVEERVILDGSMSMDPEGDPIRFEWTLSKPSRSQSRLDNNMAGIVAFTPDVAGSYRVELRTYDSLNQPSEVAAIVLITARSKFKMRVTADWTEGGDVDLHLVDENGTLFGPQDCYFLNRMPDFGVLNDNTDDPLLRDDATGAPGTEELVFVLPSDGTYQLYLHYFDDYMLGPAPVDVEVVFNDGSASAFSETITMNAGCDLWHLGEINFPASTFTEIGSALAPDCR